MVEIETELGEEIEKEVEKISSPDVIRVQVMQNTIGHIR